MSNWIFIVKDHKTEDGALTALDVYRQRMKDAFWGLDETTLNRKTLKRGDHVVFYLASPRMVFAGTAELASEASTLTAQDKGLFAHTYNRFFESDYGVKLTDIRQWPESDYRDAKLLVQDLQFIENKTYWGAYFQGGIRSLPEDDYVTITSGSPTSLVAQLMSEPDLQSQAEFALESHLEEFIAQNWNAISFGRPLELFTAGDANGRQFPAGSWSIDFLCKDTATGDFVVIELKRGKTSDAVVGQLARYMVWVKENLASTEQIVHGIVIAREADEALRTAIKIHPNMAVRLYKVDFKLNVP